MPMPTWNGDPVEDNDPRIAQIMSEAPAVMLDLLGGGAVSRRSTSELLHAAEASAWLEIAAHSARQFAVQAAKSAGASWAELGRAMGVTRATAQHRFKQAAEKWERPGQ